jgi:UDP-N-acetylmuramate dehydrogenase
MLDLVIREKLRELVADEVFFDEPLSRHTSFGVGGPADAVCFPHDQEELKNTITCLTRYGLPFKPLGNGTNIIVRDGGYRGIIVCLKKLCGMGIEEAGGGVTIHAEAGVALAAVVGCSMREGFMGMEFCAGVPGSVGGAIRMNAGAYGREIKDVAAAVTFLTNTGKIIKIDRRELNFSYRNLAVPQDYIIVAADFSLVRGDSEEIRQKVSAILARRQEKHPLQYRNAGSIFKNPGKLPAGRIIEEMGLKGLQIGEAKISEQHGNFMVNLGQARATDVLALIDQVIMRVRQERGIVLETEVHIIGEDT